MPSTLSPLRLGGVAIDFPVVMAALSGYGDWPARRVARRLGASYAVAEVMLDRFVVEVGRGRKARRYLRVEDDDHPCGAQLMGAVPEEFAPAARRLVEAGFDVIDINFGCPVKKVLGRCRGGFLLSDPPTALAIVGRVRDALPDSVPVTVKMRRGLDERPESTERFFTIFEGVFRLGAAAVTVHGRTVRQGYQGISSWDFLRALKASYPQCTVLGSGDLFTAADCLRMMAETGMDGVTAARGAIGNPWLYRQARALAAGEGAQPPSLAEQGEVIGEHYRLAEEVYGPRHACRVMRKFGIRYAELHPQPAEVRAAFIAVAEPADYRRVLRRYYGGEKVTSVTT